MSVQVLHSQEDDTEGVLAAKGISMAILFAASMICGLLPTLLSKKFKWITPAEAGDLKSKNRVVLTLLSFGGGVLLATTFMHLMPEVQHNIDWLVSRGEMKEFDFALGALLTCIGFFIMYLVEELVHMYIRQREKRNGQRAPLVRNLSVRRSRSGVEKDVSYSTTDLIDAENSKPVKGEESPPPHSHNHNSHGHSHMPVTNVDDVTSALRGLLIVLALSVHELFEGLAVGLESSTTNVWYMLGAIAAHKLVIAFCIGVELIASRTKVWLSAIYITTFAVVSPLGIGIGMILVGGEGATGAGISSVILQGLASGTLLYVIFFEIWKNDRTGILQYFSALVGFLLMFILQIFTHTHSHSHGGHDHGDEEHDQAHD